MFTTKKGSVLSAEKALRDMRINECKLLVRIDGFRLFGIVTKRYSEYDSELGEDRRWGTGITMEGEIFKEPMDRKNPKTGRLETIICRETPYILFTARNTTDPTDNDANFTWIPHQFSMNRMKALEDELGAQQRIMHRLDTDYKAMKRKMYVIKQDAEFAVEERNNLRDTTTYLQRKNLQLERENQELYTLLQRLRAHGLEVEGELSVELKKAMDRGREKAMSPHEVRLKMLRENEMEKKAIEQTVANKSFDIEDIKDVVREEVRKVAQNQPVAQPKPIIKPASEGES